MRCYGLIIPGSETSRFHIYTTPRPNPILRVKPVTRIHIGSWSSSPLFKTMAAINDTVATQMSFYDLLGIPKSGTLPEIKQAYKQLARKYHPDVSPPDRMEEYTQRFIRVQEAYETLSDPRTRALYDRDMARGLHLAFSAKRRYPYQNDEELDARSEWKNRWQDQLSGLKRRSTNKEVSGNISWAARMRRQREELRNEL